MVSRKLLLLSNSKLHGQTILQWCKDDIKSFFTKYGVTTVLLIPYANTNYDELYGNLKPVFENMNLKLESIHQKTDPVEAINSCEGIYISGGNTFLLLKLLYENQIIEPIRQKVFNGTPYMGASAGTNVSTKSISTTNDMPICCPPSFEALNLVPFNINPHYIEPDTNSTHMGASKYAETRDTRIAEYHQMTVCYDVLGLKEGTGLLVENDKATLFGSSPAKLFQKGKDPVYYEPGADLSFLLG